MTWMDESREELAQAIYSDGHAITLFPETAFWNFATPPCHCLGVDCF